MTPRRKKVQKVLEIREQTLHERAGVLVQAHEGRNLAESHALDAETHLAAATEYRRSLTAHSVNVASWIDAEQWLAHKTDRSLQAQLDLENAEIFVSNAHGNVIEARHDVKRMELLDKRLAHGEASKQLRLEQTSNDDHARRPYVNARRGDVG
jgi:flagellar export protein FliJ